MRVQHNVWYVCALSEQIDRQLRRKVIVDEPILLYRTGAGQVIALRDRCPHRFAPLSRGKLLNDVVQCGYHGLQFNTDGNCVHNPHGNVIAPNNRVRSFPVVERHGLVWLWPGDPEKASPDVIPDLSYMTAPNLKTVHRYLEANYRHDILVDNLLDLTHTDYLHLGSFASGACERSDIKVTETNNEVMTVLSQFNAPAPPHMLNSSIDRVDLQYRIRWHPGQVMTFEMATAPVGGDLATAPFYRFAHIATPASDNKTHYFISFTRGFDLDNLELDRQIADFQVAAIAREDGSMLEAVHAEMRNGDLHEMRPVMLPTDAGALRVRRIIKQLVEAEEAGRRQVGNVLADA